MVVKQVLGRFRERGEEAALGQESPLCPTAGGRSRLPVLCPSEQVDHAAWSFAGARPGVCA